jgi:DNA-binding transcriptional ArsR family regulator
MYLPHMDAVYRAISDPTRRGVLDLLATGEHTVAELNEPFPISQPAMSKHLRVLRQAGLVRERRQSRNRIYSLDARPLRGVADWVDHYERFWGSRMERLGDYLDRRP